MKNIQAKTEGEEPGYIISEKLDEQQIVDEIRGEILEQFFYELPGSGRVGLSWSGIKFVAARMRDQGHPISVKDLDVVEAHDGRSYLARAMAVDLATNEIRWGAAEQSKFIKKSYMKGNDKVTEEELNPFAYVLAASKAQRNAIRNFIPEVAIQEGYQAWKANRGKPLKVNAPPGKIG